jgi:hypothetical protein
VQPAVERRHAAARDWFHDGAYLRGVARERGPQVARAAVFARASMEGSSEQRAPSRRHLREGGRQARRKARTLGDMERDQHNGRQLPHCGGWWRLGHEKSDDPSLGSAEETL